MVKGMGKLVKNAIGMAEFAPDKMRKINLYESARLFCDVYCLLPGQSQPPHVHNKEDKIYHALSGTCTVQLGDETHTLTSGHVAVAPAGIVHGVANTSSEPATLLVVMAPHPAFPGQP